MGRAKVVVPPPKDYIPVPLEHSGIFEVASETQEEIQEDQTESSWIDGTIEEPEISTEELEKERIAQEQYEAIQRKKEEDRLSSENEVKRITKLQKDNQRITKLATKKTEKEKAKSAKFAEELQLVITEKHELEHTVTELLAKIEKLENIPVSASQVQTDNSELLKKLDELITANERLTREKEAAETAREQQIVAMRQKAIETRGSVQQLNLATGRKPNLWNRIASFVKTKLRDRRIKEATVGIKNYDVAIIQRARIAVPKILDDMEKIHEQLSILEELIQKHVELEKIKVR